MERIETIDQYISHAPSHVRDALREVRRTISAAEPDAVEAISYAIPTFKLNGHNLIHFAGYEKHIGLYATPSGHDAFADDLAQYKQGKGSVQFPLDKPMPLALITRITQFRSNEIKKGRT